MIAFATSFRASALADDWAYHVWLLEQVVHSMLAQTGGDIRVVVGCHDVPDSPLTRDPRVRFLPLDVALPAKTFDAMVTDKVLKLSAGARWAVDNGCEYVIFNDADDHVSNRIGAHINAHRGSNGWYTETQRFYTYGGRVMRLHNILSPGSGPCVIARTDLLTFARPPFSGTWADRIIQGGEQEYMTILASHQREINILAAVGIAYYNDYMRELGHPLVPLPFAGNVVINHGDSMSTSGGTNGYRLRSRLSALRWGLRLLPTMRYATAALKAEFNLPGWDQIPRAFRRTGGSVFWR